MFEKEAEERARAIEENQILGVYDNEEDCARDIGYNEGEVVGYEEGFNAGAEFGYNKANEWNFIKDGKFPAENTECLCIIRPIKEKDEPFGNKDFRGVLYYRNGKFSLEENDDSDRLLYENNSDFTKLVIAWKEIILPKENY